MALMKCEECGGKVSSKADKCPHCGAPVNENNQISEVKEISIYKEKCNRLIIIAIFLVSFLVGITMLLGSNSLFYFIKTPNMKFALYSLINYDNFVEYFFIFVFTISILTFISFILKIKSRIGAIISSFIYIVINAVYIIAFQMITANRGVVGKQFFIMLILNTILAIIPRIDKISIEKRILSKDNIAKINEKNNKIEQKHNNKKMKLIVLIISLITFLIGTVTTIVIYNINDNISLTYKEKEKNGIDQLKVTRDFINVREKPSTKSEIVGKVYKGDIFNIIEIYEKEEYIWYRIKYNGEERFVASSIEEPYVKIIYNNSNKNTNNKEIYLKTTLINEGYKETEDGIYQFVYTREGGGIVLEYNFNENTYSSFTTIEDGAGQVLLRYYIDEQKVLYVLNIEDIYSTIEYNKKTKKTSCDSELKTWCNTYEKEYTKDKIIPFIEEYHDLIN